MGSNAPLTESATPHEVALVNELLAEVRLHWRLACAWERVDPVRYNDGFSNENPYAADYHAAVARYEDHRRLTCSTERPL